MFSRCFSIIFLLNVFSLFSIMAILAKLPYDFAIRVMNNIDVHQAYAVA